MIATPTDLRPIWGIFREHPQFFPHIRQDYLSRALAQDRVLFENDAVIVFQQYLRTVRLGTALAGRGDFIIHQIVRSANASHDAAYALLSRFLTSVSGTHPCWLTVRADNARARHFYTRNAFQETGQIAWAKGSIPGVVYCRIPQVVVNTGVSELP